MTITGVDTSSHQKNWAPSRHDDFCFVKTVESTNYFNPDRSAQLKAARDNGLVVGHYAYIYHGNIQAQVDYFLTKADIRDGDLIACDWEYEGCTTEDKDEWIKAVRKRKPKNKVGLYCSTFFWKSVDTSSYYGDFLWIAEYNVSSPNIKTRWTFWQFSKTGVSNVGEIDENRSIFHTRQELRSWARTGIPITSDKKETPIVFPKAEAKVPFRGGWTCTCVATSVPFVEQRMLDAGVIKHNLDFYQFGWRNDVTASAGTHAKGGNTDTAQYSDNAIRIWRECGWNMQHRTKKQGFKEEHGHGAPIGCVHLSPSGMNQMEDYLIGRDGLLQHLPITGPKVPVIRWDDAIKNFYKENPDVKNLFEEEPVPHVIPTIKYQPNYVLTPGRYAWLPMNDKGGVSFLSGSGLVQVVAQVTVDKMALIGTVTLQIVVYDRFKKADGSYTNQFVGVIGQNDINANSGRFTGQVFAYRRVGAPSTGKVRVYRLRAFASHDCVINNVVVDASITKI